MAFDPANPPIWLRKLHVSAQQISPDDYAPTPEKGILRGCELSDAVRQFSEACARAFGSGLLPTPLHWIIHSARISLHALSVSVWIATPENLILLKLKAGRPTDFDDVISIIKNPCLQLDLPYLWSWADRLGLQGELHYILQAAASSG